jgi:hypothetical protein
VEDEFTQKVGTVSVNYLLDGYPQGGADHEFTRVCVRSTTSLPIRIVAVYIALNDNKLWNPAIDLCLYMFSPVLRVRTRAIFGEFVCWPNKTCDVRGKFVV